MNKPIARIESLNLGPLIVVTERGAQFPKDLPEIEWKKFWPKIIKVRRSINWVIGDWINFGIETYGLTYAEARHPDMADSGELLDVARNFSISRVAGMASELEIEHLRNVCYVCRQVPASLRNYALDWSHYVVVAPLTEKKQKKFLALAWDEGLTVSQLRIAVRRSEAVLAPASRAYSGFVPAAWLTEGMRYFRNQDFKEWDDERRAALKAQLKPLAEIYASL
jgi:hypothetical protein